MRDAVRLALGTLTILPVRAPQAVDRRTAGRAMVLAPVVGLLLGVIVLAALWVLGGGTLTRFPGAAEDVGWYAYAPATTAPRPSVLSPLLSAVLAVGLLAVLTRGMHLDGLADTADGLGSGKPPEEALAVMRRGDIGPFGVLTVLLVLLTQVAALQAALTAGRGVSTVVVALVVSRSVLPLLCSEGVPAARSSGLGSAVAGSVSRPALAVGLAVGVLAVALVVLGQAGWWHLAGAGGELPYTGLAGGRLSSLRLALAVVLPLAAGVTLALRCVRRLGGVTGDVLGACVEVAFTTCLLVLAVG